MPPARQPYPLVSGRMLWQAFLSLLMGKLESTARGLQLQSVFNRFLPYAEALASRAVFVNTLWGMASSLSLPPPPALLSPVGRVGLCFNGVFSQLDGENRLSPAQVQGYLWGQPSRVFPAPPGNCCPSSTPSLASELPGALQEQGHSFQPEQTSCGASVSSLRQAQRCSPFSGSRGRNGCRNSVLPLLARRHREQPPHRFHVTRGIQSPTHQKCRSTTLPQQRQIAEDSRPEQ